MRIQNTLRATQPESHWLSQGQTNLIGGFPCSLAHFLVALATSWRRQGSLYAHSKCIGNCSMRIQNMAEAALFY
jgi:hypothetical protein